MGVYTKQQIYTDMKVISLIFLLSSTYAQDWTCDECAEGEAALAEFTTSDDAIAAQTEILLAELCPTAEDPDLCVEKLPKFWAELDRIIMPVHWSYLCDDIECKNKEKVMNVYVFLIRLIYLYPLRALFPAVNTALEELML